VARAPDELLPLLEGTWAEAMGRRKKSAMLASKHLCRPTAPLRVDDGAPSFVAGV
jgi:hypothetical protein